MSNAPDNAFGMFLQIINSIIYMTLVRFVSKNCAMMQKTAKNLAQKKKKKAWKGFWKL